MCIYLDDLLFLLFGLLCVVFIVDDVCVILEVVKSLVNGLILCVGLFGVCVDNDLVDMVCVFGFSIFFVYLCNVKCELDGFFYELDYLDGDNDMIGLINVLLDEEIN